jgi:serine/threonine protein kinase
MSTEPDDTLLQTGQGQSEARAASKPNAPPTIEGYKLEELLGAGSFGEVWGGVQERTGQKVAVKLLIRRESLGWDSFRHELELLREVSDHPYIVGLIDADLSGEVPYLVMPWLAQGSLAERTPDRAHSLGWIEQISKALQHTHNKGLLHCDLKPTNILLDDGLLVRLADFGQSRLLGAEGSWGTLGWMPPEQAALNSPNVRWDIYALGATSYFLLTGEKPRLNSRDLQHVSETATLSERFARYQQLLESKPLIPVKSLAPWVDQDLADLVESCLQLDPEKRPSSMSEFLEDLRRRESGEPLLCRRPWTIRYRGWRFIKRPLVATSLLFIVLAFWGLSYANAQLRKVNIQVTEALNKVTENQVESLIERGLTGEGTDPFLSLLLWVRALQSDPENDFLRSRIKAPKVRLEFCDTIDFKAQGPQIPKCFFHQGKVIMKVSTEAGEKLISWELETGARNVLDIAPAFEVGPNKGLTVEQLDKDEQARVRHSHDRSLVSEDKSVLATMTDRPDRNRVKMVRVKDGEEIGHMEVAGRPWETSLSKDGGLFLTTSPSGSQLWSSQGEALTPNLRNDSNPGFEMGLAEIRSDGKWFTTWTSKEIRVYSVHQPSDLKLGDSDHEFLAFNPEGRLLLGEHLDPKAGGDPVITSWNLDDGTSETLDQPSGPDGQGRVFVLNEGGFWPIAGNYSNFRMPVGDATPDGQLAAVSLDVGVMIFGRETEPTIWKHPRAQAMALSTDGRYIAVAVGPELTIRDWRAQRTILQTELSTDIELLSANDDTLAVQDGPTLRCHDLDTGRELYAKPGQVASVLSENGELISGERGLTNVWDASSGELRFSLRAQGQFRVSPNSRYITLIHERKARIVDLNTGRDLVRPQYFPDRISQMTYGNGRIAFLTTAGEVRVVKLDSQSSLSSRKLQTQVEVWTGMTLDGGSGQARMLTVSEWKERKESLERVPGGTTD